MFPVKGDLKMIKKLISCASCGTKNRVVAENLSQAVCGNCKASLDVNFYQILGIPRSATQDDIKSAYRKLAFKWHPDKNSGNESATELFKLINEAYSVLSNPTQRNQYDNYLNSNQKQTNTEYKSPNIDPEVAAQIFLQEMFAFASELAFSNHNWSKIAPQLIAKGCPPGIAEYVAQACVAYRKGVVRNVAFKSFLKALAWFAVGGLITLFSYNSANPGSSYIVFWGPMLFGGYQMLKALYYLITGRVPMIAPPAPQAHRAKASG